MSGSRSRGRCAIADASAKLFPDYIGYNYRMDGFQGAVLRVKLKHLDEWTGKRQEFSALYRKLLANARVEFPQDDPQNESVYHLFVVYVENRDAVRAALEARGVQSAIHYPVPLHLQAAYAALGHRRGAFPHAERLFASACSSVPCSPK